MTNTSVFMEKELENPTKSKLSALGESALRYAKQGMKVFPLLPDEKKPLIKGWQHRATTDSEMIKTWWTEHQDANIGFITGEPNGIVVLDVDIKNDKDGIASCKRLLGDNALESTMCASTPTGGYHLYFKSSSNEINNKVEFQPGLDLRGCGGYVVAPPSIIDGIKYSWSYMGEIAEFPTKIQNIISPETTPSTVATVASDTTNGAQPDMVIREGERNDHIFKLACTENFRLLSNEQQQTLILSEARKCIPPLSDDEALRCLESARTYNKQTNDTDGDHTDLWSAKKLIQQYGDEIRYLTEHKKWLFWNGSMWVIDNAFKIDQYAENTIRELFSKISTISDKSERTKLAKHLISSQSRKKLDDMVKLAMRQEGVAISSDDLNKDNMLLGVSNGTINLSTGELRTPNPKDLITKKSEVTYDPSAKCPEWLKFLDTTFSGEKDLIRYIKRAVGYSLTGLTSEQCLFFLYGTGANGKSTFIQVLTVLLGDYSSNTQPDTFMVKNGGGISNDVARLAGKRLVVTTELEDGKRFAESLIKSLTGGDTITSRFMYGEYFEFNPEFKIWMAGNHKPVIRGNDDGIWRRIKLIPFSNTVAKEDRDSHLQDKLSNELSGIFNWALEGCLEWQDSGLGGCSSINDATTEYRTEMDQIQEWIDECCNLQPNASTQATVLYKNYKEWSEDYCGYSMTQKKFGMKLKERGFSSKKGKYVTYKGIEPKELSRAMNDFNKYSGYK